MDYEARRRGRAAARRRAVRRRRLVAVGLLALGALLAGLAAGGGSSSDERAGPRPVERPAELPRGGRRLFPDRRVVAFYGAPQNPELGALGVGSPAQAGARLERQARAYARRRRPVLPAFELIATLVHRTPGEDGDFSSRQRPAVIDRYLREARRRRALLVLDVQPGRAPFMREVRALRPWLEQPDVALALDPEWSMGAGETPGESIGSTDARTVNEVAGYLSRLVSERRLPEKLLVVHRFTEGMIEDERTLRAPPGVALTVDVDGFGTPEVKRRKYRDFTRGRRGRRHGFKLFYREDSGLMSPGEVLALRPAPDLVVYE